MKNKSVWFQKAVVKTWAPQSHNRKVTVTLLVCNEWANLFSPRVHLWCRNKSNHARSKLKWKIKVRSPYDRTVRTNAPSWNYMLKDSHGFKKNMLHLMKHKTIFFHKEIILLKNDNITGYVMIHIHECQKISRAFMKGAHVESRPLDRRRRAAVVGYVKLPGGETLASEASGWESLQRKSSEEASHGNLLASPEPSLDGHAVSDQLELRRLWASVSAALA